MLSRHMSSMIVSPCEALSVSLRVLAIVKSTPEPLIDFSWVFCLTVPFEVFVVAKVFSARRKFALERALMDFAMTTDVC